MSKRAKRWKIKTDPRLWHPRLEALHPISSELIAKAYTNIDEVYTHVRKILDKHGIIAQSRLLYRSFIEELWELSRKYRGKAFNIEGGAVAIKYWFYGADRDILFELSLLFNLKREYLEKTMEEASYVTIEEAVRSALRKEVGAEALDRINVCFNADISAGKIAELKAYERWTIYLKTQGAIEIAIELSPDGTTWYEPEESPVVFTKADDILIVMNYDATHVKITGSNPTPVTCQILGVI